MSRKSVAILLTLVMQSTAAFSGIHADYHEFQLKRFNLEAIQDKQIVARREKAEQARRELENRWGRCAGGRWSYVWGKFAKRLEETRKELENSRKDILQLRRKIRANLREYDRQIDSIERQRSELAASAYESAIRDFISRVELEYLEPFEEDYIYAAKEYLNAVDIYLSRVGDAVTACETNDLRPVVAEEALKGLDKVFEAALKIAQFLKGK